MKKVLSTFILLFLVHGAFGQAATAPDTFGQLSRSASEELAKSSRELAKLREEIDAEKVPLGKKLTSLESRLAQLRTQQEEISRQADTSNLDSVNIKTAIKVQEVENNYIIDTLLGDYSKTFETKINPTEMQYCAAAIDAAKQAAGNNALTASEKLAAQVAFVKFTSNRLFDVIGGMRFSGEAVDQSSIVVKGQFAIIGPVALFSNDTGTVAGLLLPQTGTAKPLVRPLDPMMQSGLVSLIASGEGTLPLDPSGGAALKALVQKTNLIHIFQKGGPIMWPLLLASILSLGTVLERVIFLLWQRICRNPKALDQFFKAVTRGDHEEAIRISRKSKYFVVRALGYALKHKEQSLANALIYAQAQEIKKFRRGIPILDTVITLAPLLGLLGTVTGMMGSFSLIGGDLGAPGAITGGIAEALIATAFGLGIAITSLIPFNILNTRLEEVRHEIESAATQLELLIHPGDRPLAATAHGANIDPVITHPGLKVVSQLVSAAKDAGTHPVTGKE